MKVEHLKKKYRRILQDKVWNYSSDEENDDPTETNMTEKSKNINDQHSYNTFVSKTETSIVIALKERIAQSLKNLSVKDDQIINLKQHIVRLQIQVKFLEEQLQKNGEAVQSQQKKVINEKINQNLLNKQLQSITLKMKAMQLDQDLQLKQIQYYKNQVKTLKRDGKKSLNKIKESQTEIKTLEQIKLQNIRLKDDKKRMQTIILECCNDNKKFDVKNKHYLGKPYKEGKCWFSQNLIGEVQLFLKKQQLGKSNKQFSTNLVKFIDCYLKNTNKSQNLNTCSRIKSESKNKSHRRNSSTIEPTQNLINFSQIGSGTNQSTLKKSLLIHKFKKYENRRNTEYFNIPERDQTASIFCLQVLQEYNKNLKQSLNHQPIAKSKVLDLSDKMIKNVLKVFQDYESSMH